MIKEVIMYTVICDGCGVDAFEGEEFRCWNDKSFARDSAMDSGWIIEDDKHYCPDCYEYDDDDNLGLKTKQQ